MSKFDFWGIFSKNNTLKKVNLGPGAGWSIRKCKCLNIRKTHVFSIQISWHKKSWDKRKSNFVTEEILLRIHLVALSKWNFTLAVLALKLDHWDVGFNSFYFLFLLKISHLFSIEVLARWVIVLMFLLYIGSGGWKTNVCWLLIRVGAKIAAAIRVSPQDLRPLHLWKAKN